jgi:hypothetical protein
LFFTAQGMDASCRFVMHVAAFAGEAMGLSGTARQGRRRSGTSVGECLQAAYEAVGSALNKRHLTASLPVVVTPANQMLELWIASTTASVTCFVVALPPTSGVRMPAPVTFSTARISRAEASVSPR